jgi:hypothetical protein
MPEQNTVEELSVLFPLTPINYQHLVVSIRLYSSDTDHTHK